ncbi:histidine phosphatase family protein [Microbacterium lacus]|uniref:histidine phosphatase family protein n=1 Tax=Microbacterium lacus TaxID=415217 RepID=UPI00384C6B2D
MTTLLLVRHGETDWNAARRIQGSTDIPLNDTGRQQARDAATALRGVLNELGGVVPAVVSSDLSRACETAQIIADELGVPHSGIYPALRERAYGQAEGLEVEEFFARWGPWHTAEVPGAEIRADLRDRALRALRNVTRDVRRRTAPVSTPIIVVSHGALIREVLGRATAEELLTPGVRIANGAHFVLRWERDHVTLRGHAPGALV